MRVGTKSVLFGVHQCLWHPITVILAWRHIYGTYPSWRMLICIIVHDLGYVGCSTIDGEDGERHVELGARIAGWLFGSRYRDEVLFHSRHYARNAQRDPSDLCWADKASVLFDPAWFYLLRARLSGELSEYRGNAAAYVSMEEEDITWFLWYQSRVKKLLESRRGDAVPY